MKTNLTDFYNLSQEKSLRFDFVYQRLVKNRHLQADEYYSFRDFFSVAEEKIKLDELMGDFRYCQIGDVDKSGVAFPVLLNFDIRNIIDEDYYKKIEKGDVMRVSDNDILMSFLLPQDDSIRGKFVFINNEISDVLFSTAFLRVIPRIAPQLMFYCLQSVFYKDLVATARIRKGYTGYATLSKDDLRDMRFSQHIVDKLISNSSTIESKISEIEAKINCKRNSIQPISKIIDSIFQKEFGFNYDRFEELKAEHFYVFNQKQFSNNPDLRFSAKFHRPAGDYVMEQLKGITDKKIRHYISEPIVLGASITPKDFDENGEAYYVSMATIKSLEIVLDDTQLVSASYYDSKRSKTVKKGDIIMARSGVAIGKVAIVKDDFDGIFADFTMRIRFDQDQYNSQFAYYYFRSRYFQYLIEVYKKGLQNQNIFPVVIQEFPIPDIPLLKQQHIVEEIQSEINKQNNIKDEISFLRSQIDAIIIKTISA